MTLITAPSDNKDASIIAIIAELEAKREKATKGKWLVMHLPSHSSVICGGLVICRIENTVSKHPLTDEDRSNTDSIAAEHNAIPLLIEAYRVKVDECARLSSAIKRALNDSESGNGWGPDVTVCGYLHAALHPEAVCIGIDMASGPDVTICHNCDSELPEGCGGRFKDDGAACALNFTHPEAGGGEKNGK